MDVVQVPQNTNIRKDILKEAEEELWWKMGDMNEGIPMSNEEWKSVINRIIKKLGGVR